MKSWRNLFTRRLYVDAAASTPLSRTAKRELVRLFTLSGNPGGLHKEAVVAKRALERARERVAKAIGAHADEIIFTSGGTEANNLAFLGALRPVLVERDEAGAVTTAIEHSSVLAPLQALEREGLYTTHVSVDASGVVSLNELRDALGEGVALVSVQMVNSEVGTVQPIKEIAKALRKSEKKILFHSDAAQAPLWLNIKVDSLGVDLLTLDGQKIMGPKGVGVLYVRRGTRLEPVMHGGGQEQGLRSGTENAALAGAFAAALEEAQAGAERRARRVAAVRDYCFALIKKNIPSVRMNGAEGEARVANNMHISIPRLDGEMAVLALDARGIAASTRSACDTDVEAPSHVLAALGVSPELARASLRITFLPNISRVQARRLAQELMNVYALYGKFMDTR